MITDEMVERGCVALVWAQINDAGLHPDELEDATPQNVWDDVNPDDGGHDHDTIRKHVRAVLTAALGDAVVVPADTTEHRVLCRLAWNNWADTPDSRREIAASEARDPISAAAWDRVIAALTAALAVTRHGRDTTTDSAE